MTASDFRELALALPETEESSHMGHPDFRVRGKIFATLGYPNDLWGMVKLTPEQQRDFVQAAPEMVAPGKGGWGLQGATSVCLEEANRRTLQRALLAAWTNITSKTAIKETARKKGTPKKSRS